MSSNVGFMEETMDLSQKEYETDPQFKSLKAVPSLAQ